MRRRPVIMSSRNSPLAASSVSGAPSDDGHGADRLGLAGVDRRFERQLQDRRDDDSNGRAPEEREDEQPRRLGLPSVEPQIGEHDDRHRHAGQREADAGADGVDRGQPDHDQPGYGAEHDDHADRRPNLADSPRQPGIGHQSRVIVGTGVTRRRIRAVIAPLRYIRRPMRLIMIDQLGDRVCPACTQSSNLDGYPSVLDRGSHQ